MFELLFGIRNASFCYNYFVDYKTKTKLILPFKGVWVVGNGGRSPKTNNHQDPDGGGPKDQKFAYDFISVHVKNEGKNLEDYEAFGAEVICLGNGIISEVLNSRADVLIGETDENVVTGNMILIDHKKGEWSLICHLKQNSIKVKIGDRVKQGDVIGLCGNSGNTTEPHVHYQLQDGPFIHKATGLPAQFARIIVNGEEKKNYEPIRGEEVSNL